MKKKKKKMMMKKKKKKKKRSNYIAATDYRLNYDVCEFCFILLISGF